MDLSNHKILNKYDQYHVDFDWLFQTKNILSSKKKKPKQSLNKKVTILYNNNINKCTSVDKYMQRTYINNKRYYSLEKK